VTFPAQLTVTFRPGIGAAFGNAFVLGSALNGVLGSNVLGGSSAVPVDITNQVRGVSIRRGRDRQFDSYSTGSAVITIIDDNGDFNPDNTTGPYFGELLPGRQIRVSATYNGVSYWLYSGYAVSYQWRWLPELERNLCTITCEDPFRFLAFNQIETVPTATAGQTSGQRVESILEAAQWPPSLQLIDTAGVTVQADPGEQRNVLEAAQTVELTELGAFYTDPAGRVVFRSRGAVGLAAAGPAPLFTDDPNPAGPVVRYQSLEVGLDDTELANDVTVERSGGTPQNLTDPASIDDYFRRSVSYTDLLMETDTAALNAANQILAYRRQPELEVRNVAIEMISDETPRITAGLGLDIGAPIEVTRSAVGGPITTVLTVQGVTHDITPGQWVTTFSTARPLSFPFILGSTVYGVLGTSTL